MDLIITRKMKHINLYRANV